MLPDVGAHTRHSTLNSAGLKLSLQCLGQWQLFYMAPPHLHHVGQAIVQDQVVGHAYPVWLHGVSRPIVEAPDVWVVEVRHLRIHAKNVSGAQAGDEA